MDMKSSICFFYAEFFFTLGKNGNEEKQKERNCPQKMFFERLNIQLEGRVFFVKRRGFFRFHASMIEDAKVFQSR